MTSCNNPAAIVPFSPSIVGPGARGICCNRHTQAVAPTLCAAAHMPNDNKLPQPESTAATANKGSLPAKDAGEGPSYATNEPNPPSSHQAPETIGWRITKARVSPCRQPIQPKGVHAYQQPLYPLAKPSNKSAYEQPFNPQPAQRPIHRMD